MGLGRWIVFASLAGLATLTALEGCSTGGSTFSGDVCASRPACQTSTAPSTSAQAQCTALINDPKCGEQYKAMKECQTFRAQCTSSGAFSSSATNTACRAEITANSLCNSSADAGPDGCKLRTCAQANANCGEVDNGCGTPLQCGTCTNGQTCGGGTPNRCGCACDPTWCGTLVACGTTITCPTNCAAPNFCGGGGIANRCGCVPSGATALLTATSVTTATIALEAGAQVNWTSATNARASDNSNASATLATGVTTQYLVALSYGVGLPAGATVDGIVVQVERTSTAGLATADYAVHLVKNTQIQIAGDNKAQAGIIWPTTETTVTYGGPTDTWGNTWTAADINAGGFGVAFAATYTGQTGSEQARVDSIRVTVHYSNVACP